jgi:hypothetical protein
MGDKSKDLKLNAGQNKYYNKLMLTVSVSLF